MQWQWIEDHLDHDPIDLRLHRPPSMPQVAIEQIAGRRSASGKLSDTLRRCKHFLFPSGLLAQQCTSDAIAYYHTTLAGERPLRILDMTGGLGIDAFHMAGAGHSVTACEIDIEAAGALRHNASLMGLGNVEVINADSSAWIVQAQSDSYDLIFIDPARRTSEYGRRLRSLSECSPDVEMLESEMLRVAPRVWIKASPMLDISSLAAMLKHIRSISAIGHTRTCSELLIELSREADSLNAEVKAITLSESGKMISGTAYTLSDTVAGPFLTPRKGMIWFEPYAPEMKAGHFGALGQLYDIKQLSRHAHVYLCQQGEAPEAFPGQRYAIEDVVKADKAAMRLIGSRYAGDGADVAVRHFPMSAEELRRAMGIRRSSDTRIVGCKDAADKKWLVILRRV